MKRFLAIFVVLLALLLIGCSEKKSETEAPETNAPETEAPEEPTTEGLEYTLLDDGTYAVSVGTAGNNKSIVIPSQYNGRRVSEIAEEAFIGCINITKVVIPNSVTKIGDNAFANCTSLTSITIPDSVTEIGSSAFKKCTSLTGIAISDSVTKIGAGAFLGCTSLTGITIPDSIIEIGSFAFNGCSSLKNLKYMGTIEQWNAIKKVYIWSNDIPATVVCTDGEVSLDD